MSQVLQRLTSYFLNCLKHIQLERLHLWCFSVCVPTNIDNIMVISHW